MVYFVEILFLVVSKCYLPLFQDEIGQVVYVTKHIILDNCCGCLASVLLLVMVYCCVNIDD